MVYRFNKHLRTGLFLDQTITNNSLPSNFDVRNSQPMTGLFAVLSENNNGTGPALKLSAAYNASKLTITRDNSLNNTEAGQGKANLVSKGAAAELSYGFTFAKNWIIAPYLGLRKTSITRSSYTEDSGADFPITYNALERKSTTAIAGTTFTGQITKNLGTKLSLGLEHDTSNAIEGYAGNIAYMGSFNLNAPKMRKTRGFASLGTFYNLAQHQHISFTMLYAQQSLNHEQGITAYANYTVGF